MHGFNYNYNCRDKEGYKSCPEKTEVPFLFQIRILKYFLLLRQQKQKTPRFFITILYYILNNRSREVLF